jgi:hypothetical protein
MAGQTGEGGAAEMARLKEARDQGVTWRKWGPYLSERQWGTVREDYSDDGSAWEYFSHDQARSRTYRWGEDGLAGISDDRQRLCFALALWNGKDPIIKERLFGLTNREGNHGEDCKEYYFYLDSTPTHSYMKYLYKYPQATFPYDKLVLTNRSRGTTELEYELLNTGVFDDNRYFDVFVEYAKSSPQDILIQITVHNRGSEAAELHILPTVWFRNDWAGDPQAYRPILGADPDAQAGRTVIKVEHREVATRFLYCQGAPTLLFTENETNNERIFGQPNPSPFVKDGINNYVVCGRKDLVNPALIGTKAAPHYQINVAAGQSHTLRLRLTDQAQSEPLGDAFGSLIALRRCEADEFYKSITPPSLSSDHANVMRQAMAGMLWSKQFYYYDVDKWLGQRGSGPFLADRKPSPRNDQWHHMYNGDIISMPDKWEYPWYAAWDLAFHALAFTLVDIDFAKSQLKLMLRERYMHPNGQIPAYEWNFGDVNPPVHAFATIFTYYLEKGRRGEGDRDWLKSCFQKLLLNFTWWVNRKDRTGRNVFEGGFLGLDNVGVFDRSAPLPTGGYLEQADGTAWMALYCQNMLQIAVELAMTDEDYAEMALKFAEHYLWIASAMSHLGGETSMWDEEDGFFYDVLRLPDGKSQRLKVRSIVGLLPLAAATTFEGKFLEKYPEMVERLTWFLKSRPGVLGPLHDVRKPGVMGRRLLSTIDENRLRRILSKMLDENEFLSPYGIRSLSRYHADHHYIVHAGGQEYRVSYLPAESDTGMFGGNSNWRGPIWMPVNGLLLRALIQLYGYYGDDFKVDFPTGSGRQLNLFQVAQEIANRLGNIFLRDQNGRRAVFGGTNKFQEDPHWRDYLLFYEYFHGDNGAGIGASHQTGWTGIIALMMQMFAIMKPQVLLTADRDALYVRHAAETDKSERFPHVPDTHARESTARETPGPDTPTPVTSSSAFPGQSRPDAPRPPAAAPS